MPAVAPLIIAAEAAAGLALLVPAATLTPSTAVLTPATGSLMAALLLCLYTGAIAVNLGRGRTAIDCGCGGQATPLSGWLLTRNGLLLCLAWAAAALPSGTADAGRLRAGSRKRRIPLVRLRKRQSVTGQSRQGATRLGC